MLEPGLVDGGDSIFGWVAAFDRFDRHERASEVEAILSGGL